MNIFVDLDGTILDISLKYYRIYSDFCTKKEISPLKNNEYWTMKRSKRNNEEIFGNKDLGEEFKLYFSNRIESDEYLKYDRLLPNTFDTLENLKSDHILYLVTLRRNKESLDRQLESFGLKPFFKRILTTAPPSFVGENSDFKVELIKPLANKGDLIVGDTKAEVACGKVLDLTTISVLSGISDENVLKKLGPDFIVNNLSELRKCL